MLSTRTLVCFVPGLLLLTAIPQRAEASGFFLTERGVRSLGRGGAFVAGAEEIESLWINPAGLKDAGPAFRMEGMLNFMRADFQRIDDGGNTRPSVHMGTAPLPIPMLGVTTDHGLDDWDFGYGFYVPNFSIYDWPSSVDGGPAPQRYSLYSLRGGILGNFTVGAAWHGVKGLSIGASASLITGRFKASLALSACDGFVCTQPEDPAFDATTVMTLKRFATVMVGAGLIYQVGPIKLGASVQSPWKMKGKTRFDIDLPADALFSDAAVDGSEGTVTVPFGMIARGGVEYAMTDELRMEVAMVWEQWSRQQAITADASDVHIRNVVGIGDYQVGKVVIDRNMKNAYSIRGGFEFDLSKEMTLRGGLSYDTSAFDSANLSPLTPDGDKYVMSFGFTMRLGDVMDVDLVYSHVFVPDQKVRDSQVLQPSAIRPYPDDAERSAIGNGNYSIAADIVGIGSTFRF